MDGMLLKRDRDNPVSPSSFRLTHREEPVFVLPLDEVLRPMDRSRHHA